MLIFLFTIGSIFHPSNSYNIAHLSHVILPKELAKTLPKSRLLTESEWRGIGVQQSRGWQHYAIHRYVIYSIHMLLLFLSVVSLSLTTFFLSFLCWVSPEPHILLFRRPLGTDPQSGRVDPDLERKAREEYRATYGRA